MQLIIFKLENEFFGCDLKTLREIHHLMPVTQVPMAPSFVKGVSNLRGIILPVIDLAQRLGFKESLRGKNGRVLIVEDQGESLGFEIDGLKEVIKAEPSAVLPFDSSLDFKGREAVWGMLRLPFGIVTLLNLKALI